MNPLLRLNTSLHRAYHKKVARTRHRIAKVMNAEFVICPDNYIDRRIWVEGHYEKKQMKYLMGAAAKQPFDAFLDIGANFGLYSCVIGVNRFVEGVHAFECDPRNLYRLYGHLEMNGLRDMAAIHPYALGDRSGTVEFSMAPDNNTGHSAVGGGGHSIQVPQKALDDVMDPREQNLLIKIDVEGYEENVLKGMRNILRNNFCLIQMEVLQDNPGPEDYLRAAGYKKIHQIGRDYYFSNMKA